MLQPIRKKLAAIAVPCLLATLGFGQQAAQQGGQPQAQQQESPWKDRAEYDLYEAMQKASDPAKKLELLNQWEEKYPDTKLKEARYLLKINAYRDLNQPANIVKTAKELLQAMPGNFQGLYWIMTLTPSLPDTSEPVLAEGEKASKELTGILGDFFADSKKPANVSEQQWKQTRDETAANAHKTLGWIARTRKNWPEAEKHFRESLAINQNQGEVTYWRGEAVLAQKNPDTQAKALYYFARAAAFDGTGALPPQGRQQVKDYLTKVYTTFHGSDEGLAEIMERAKTNPEPPDDFKILSQQQVDYEREKSFMENEPQLYLWRNLKTQLNDGGQSFFDSRMKNAALPPLKGKVVSVNGKEVVISMLSDQPEATLTLDKAYKGALEPGTVIYFEGVPQTYRADPFSINFEVESTKIMTREEFQEKHPAPPPGSANPQ